MTRYFAVRQEAGPGWDHSRERTEQDAWPAHAAFMNGLAGAGFIVLGGPIDGTRALLIFDAESAEEIESRLADDPWTPLQILSTTSIEPWQILLDRSARVQPR